MTTVWDQAISFVLEAEGGYTLDPHDPGGETNFGISKKAFPDLDIKNLTVDDAKAIYYKDYWLPCRCEVLPDAWAIALFDCAVNQGISKAVRIMQDALGIATDGVVGPETIAAAAGATERTLKKFLALRLAEYARLIAANNNLLVFSVNWAFRVVSLAGLILAKADIA